MTLASSTRRAPGGHAVRNHPAGTTTAGWILSLPALLGVAFLLILPIGQAVYYSMTNWNGLTSTWVGPSAYLQLFQDPTFRRVLENNGLLLLFVPIMIAIPLGISFLLHEAIWGWKFFRSVIFVPTAISWVVIGLIAARFYALNGILNGFLSSIGLGFIKTNMLGSTRQAFSGLGNYACLVPARNQYDYLHNRTCGARS